MKSQRIVVIVAAVMTGLVMAFLYYAYVYEPGDMPAPSDDIPSTAMMLRIDQIGSGSDLEQHRKNCQEAIAAFQQVLLLDANNTLAKLYLAGCLMDRSINRRAEARYLFREILDTVKRPGDRFLAKINLAAIYAAKDPDTGMESESGMKQGLDMLNSYIASETNAGDRLQYEQFRRSIESRSSYRRTLTRDYEGPEFEQELARQLQAELEQSRQTNKVTEIKAYNEMRIRLAQGEDRDTAWLAPLCRRLGERFPELKPYILIGFLSLKIGPDSPIARDFSDSVARASANPKQVYCPASYFTEIFKYAWTWAMRNQQTNLIAQMADARCRAIKEGCAPELNETERIYLAYAYLGVGRWREALDYLEPFGNRILKMDREGPWGDNFVSPFIPALLARECRQHLGLPPKRFPGQFDLPKPIISLDAGFTFIPEGNKLWVVSPANVSCYENSGNRVWEQRLPDLMNMGISCLAQTPDRLWIGTSTSGVYEFDKLRRVISKHYTDKDGLLFNGVMALHYLDGTLFIGQGNDQFGGLSSLAVATGKITSFLPTLKDPAQVNIPFRRAVDDPLNGPPTHPVRALASAIPGELWIMVLEKGLQRYCPEGQKWETHAFGINQQSTLVVSQETIVVGGHGGFGMDGKMIGLMFVKENPKSDQIFSTADGLPHERVTALAMDGHYLWVGGWGYVAVIDCQKMKVIRSAQLLTDEVNDLAVSGDFVYLRHQNSITRFPRALALEGVGN